MSCQLKTTSGVKAFRRLKSRSKLHAAFCFPTVLFATHVSKRYTHLLQGEAEPDAQSDPALPCRAPGPKARQNWSESPFPPIFWHFPGTFNPLNTSTCLSLSAGPVPGSAQARSTRCGECYANNVPRTGEDKTADPTPILGTANLGLALGGCRRLRASLTLFVGHALARTSPA